MPHTHPRHLARARLAAAGLWLALASRACGDADEVDPAAPERSADERTPTRAPARRGLEARAGYDPLAAARRAGDAVENREAVIPPQCYTKTDATFNPCWTCHTRSTVPNAMFDSALQAEYAFSEVGLRNAWRNLFEDRRAEQDALPEAAVLEYVREDNYAALARALAELPREDYPGYRPDLELARGFDAHGFAVDGSGWRAFRYKPFLGTFWPTNGSADDVMIRLPDAFRQAADGAPSRAIYQINLAILEAAIAGDPAAGDELRWPTEALDETAAGVDLDGDGALTRGAVTLAGLPVSYVGGAAGWPVRRGVYPEGAEFLHSVRYLDPDAPSLIAPRMKELRYAKKVKELDRWAMIQAYERERDEKDEGRLPVYTGSPLVGLRNAFGWQLQGFIEDEAGRLRLQTHEEHLFCMGCHSTIGVTVDQTFAFARKLPGARGWAYQDLAGVPDVPQLGHARPEALVYFTRAGAGDEFRSNDELLARFFPNGQLDEREVLRAAPGGDLDLRYLVTPSRARALALNRAAMVRARHQDYIHGRDPVLAPARNVHQVIENGSTGLAEQGRTYLDGRLRLDWRGVEL